jgi:hypothetical protein
MKHGVKLSSLPEAVVQRLVVLEASVRFREPGAESAILRAVVGN